MCTIFVGINTILRVIPDWSIWFWISFTVPLGASESPLMSLWCDSALAVLLSSEQLHSVVLAVCVWGSRIASITDNYYSLFRLSGIRECRKGVSPTVSLSICLSSRPCTFLHDGWAVFRHIGYHDQLPWAADAYNIELVSVPNLSNYGNFFIHFECLWYLRDECGDCFSYLVQLSGTMHCLCLWNSI